MRERSTLSRGLKRHFANSRVDYHNREHVDRVRNLFAAANKYRMAFVAHMRTSISAKIPYGAEEARIFLNEIVPAASDIPLQIAHLAGAGGHQDPLIDEALAVFAEAIEKGDPRTKNLYFDVGTAPDPLRIRCGLRHESAAARRLGGVPTHSLNRGRIPDHRRERPSVHEVIQAQ